LLLYIKFLNNSDESSHTNTVANWSAYFNKLTADIPYINYANLTKYGTHLNVRMSFNMCNLWQNGSFHVVIGMNRTVENGWLTNIHQAKRKFFFLYTASKTIVLIPSYRYYFIIFWFVFFQKDIGQVGRFDQAGRIDPNIKTLFVICYT